jgi:uncharacterized protein (DUF2252 family)
MPAPASKPKLAASKQQSVPVRRASSGPRRYPTRKEARAAGKALRSACPRESHAIWKPPAKGRDAVELVLLAGKGRHVELLPMRHGRMVRSAFTFYRGAALTMAADLSTTPATGVRVQCCGDAHLSNFGGFATAERRIIFSINDLDETLPAPWEWDVKRLAASFVVACRDRSLGEGQARETAARCLRAYRESIREFSELKSLELWYHALEAEDLLEELPPKLRKRLRARLQKEEAKSRGEEMFPKMVEQRAGRPLIKDQLPTIFHHKDVPAGKVERALADAFAMYRSTLHSAYQALFDRYELRDAAIKVVGVGSVGMMCWVLLLMGADDDALFLQVKEARASVLEPYAGASVFENHGHRVVDGYRRLQPASDMFLGWAEAPERHYFFRQLRDMKVSPNIESFGREEMDIYATWCGRALALSHARSGNSAMIGGYLGKSDAFDQAVTAFSVAYADQNEQDHAAFRRAVKSGKVPAVIEKDR